MCQSLLFVILFVIQLSFLKEMKCKNIGQAISILEKFDQEVDINCSDHVSAVKHFNGLLVCIPLCSITS